MSILVTRNTLSVLLLRDCEVTNLLATYRITVLHLSALIPR